MMLNKYNHTLVEVGRDIYRSCGPDVVHEAWLIDQKCILVPTCGNVNHNLTFAVNSKMQTHG